MPLLVCDATAVSFASAAVQAELRARLIESEGQTEQLRVLLQRQQESHERESDASKQRERNVQVCLLSVEVVLWLSELCVKVEMEQRTAVLRQLMEDRVMSAQQRSDSELKQMMREISRIQTQADDKIADNQKADMRDRK